MKIIRHKTFRLKDFRIKFIIHQADIKQKIKSLIIGYNR